MERVEGNQAVYKYRRADRITIADQPTLTDPYEKKTVALKVRVQMLNSQKGDCVE